MSGGTSHSLLNSDSNSSPDSSFFLLNEEDVASGEWRVVFKTIVLFIGEGDNGSSKLDVSPYDEAMEALSSLITKRSRADKSNKGDRFDLLFDYLKILELDESISQMKIIHVAGTKGRDQLALLQKLYYAIVASILGFSHLLISLMFEKDFDWMVRTYVKRSSWHTSGGVMID
ncbi:unnamed protein product [Ilex paraguariensis]|uniref:Uncharacterized protein n=1 Tax=Ilex paraguariensis TaxID=185542 RepID=A0ABC8ST65_9AQUA